MTGGSRRVSRELCCPGQVPPKVTCCAARLVCHSRKAGVSGGSGRGWGRGSPVAVRPAAGRVGVGVRVSLGCGSVRVAAGQRGRRLRAPDSCARVHGTRPARVPAGRCASWGRPQARPHRRGLLRGGEARGRVAVRVTAPHAPNLCEEGPAQRRQGRRASCLTRHPWAGAQKHAQTFLQRNVPARAAESSGGSSRLTYLFKL